LWAPLLAATLPQIQIQICSCFSPAYSRSSGATAEACRARSPLVGRAGYDYAVSGNGRDAPTAAMPDAARSIPSAALTRTGAKVSFVIPFSAFALIFFAGVVAPSTTWWEKLLLGLVFAAIVLVIVRVAHLAVVPKPDQLVIRNLRNTHRIPWSQIEKITEPGPVPASVYLDNALALRDRRLLVVLRDGAVISATLFDQRLFSYRYSGNAPLLAAVAELNRLRLERS
jgi:hypothetical protein